MDPNILHNISYGMYIVASNRAGEKSAQIANTVFQITSEPATIAISINKKNLTHEHIESSLHFSVSILEEDTPIAFIGKFGFRSGRELDKFKETKFKMLVSGCPVVLDHAIGYIEAEVIKKLDCDTHTLFVGKTTGSNILKKGKPMTYAYYHAVKRGRTPETAPTFIRGETGSKNEGEGKR